VQSYRLVFADDGVGVARRVEFEAESLSDALIFAHREARHRSAELWHGDLRLCAIAGPRRERAPDFLPEHAFARGAAV
jgi:hypothetical protein